MPLAHVMTENIMCPLFVSYLLMQKHIFEQYTLIYMLVRSLERIFSVGWLIP